MQDQANPIQQLQSNPAWKIVLNKLQEFQGNHVQELRTKRGDDLIEAQGRVAAYEDIFNYIKEQEKK